MATSSEQQVPRPEAQPREGDAATAVSVRRVSMLYSGTPAVDGVSFDLQQGKFLTILGPSGSGKTTLLRMVAGFQSPSAGEIFINGAPVSAVPAHRRSIGMVFQRLALFPHMTAAQNVAFPLAMRRFDARTIPGRVRDYLDLVRLGPYADRRINELSGGQQQRVAIARALVFAPDLLLLDEPLAALDRKLREDMQLEFRRIQRELGVTTINVTHDQREALVVSDQIAVMDKGRIQQLARPAETYRTPANAFVAGFVGVTNFIPGAIISADGGSVGLRSGALDLIGRLAGAGSTPAAGHRATGALRAEQVRIAASEALLNGCETVTTGRVADVIFEGERVVYEISPDRLEGMIRVFDHDPVAHAEFLPGASVALGWNARDLMIFPTEPAVPA